MGTTDALHRDGEGERPPGTNIENGPLDHMLHVVSIRTLLLP